MVGPDSGLGRRCASVCGGVHPSRSGNVYVGGPAAGIEQLGLALILRQGRQNVEELYNFTRQIYCRFSNFLITNDKFFAAQNLLPF